MQPQRIHSCHSICRRTISESHRWPICQGLALSLLPRLELARVGMERLRVRWSLLPSRTTSANCPAPAAVLKPRGRAIQHRSRQASEFCHITNPRICRGLVVHVPSAATTSAEGLGEGNLAASSALSTLRRRGCHSRLWSLANGVPQLSIPHSIVIVHDGMVSTVAQPPPRALSA